MRTVKLCLSLLTAACLVWSQPDLVPKLDAVARGYQKERGFMGSVLVAKGGVVVLEKGYGMANLEWDVPNGPDTRFRLGSITKQFTATLVLQLAEQGKLNVEEPVSKYVDGLPEAWSAITIHQLLNHTSGIVSYTGLPEFGSPKLRRMPLSPLEIVLLSKDKKPDFQPGEGYKYNNTGYVLLGHLIERVTGKKYDAVLSEAILNPLGMKDSGYDWTRSVLKHRASGYGFNRSTKEYQNGDFLDMSLPHAAGSLYSTVRDLYKWDRALHSEKLLKKASLEKMFTPGRNNYGYGWIIDTRNGRKRIGHGGGINGFSTLILRYPEQDAVVIALGNVENGDTGAVAERMASALFGEPVELPWERKQVSVDPKIFERYVGVYKLPPFDMTVTVEDGKLMVQPANQPRAQAFAESETRFFVTVVDASFEFILGPDGKAQEMVLRQGDREQRGKRVP